MKALIDPKGVAGFVACRRWLLLASICTATAGCSGGEIEKVVVEGTVTVSGRSPDRGEIRFVPIENTPGPISAGLIDNGYFRIADRGGVPVGKHRVEVAACRKTGKKVVAPLGVDLIDEYALIVPEKYTNERSPLVIQITDDTADAVDIAIP